MDIGPKLSIDPRKPRYNYRGKCQEKEKWGSIVISEKSRRGRNSFLEGKQSKAMVQQNVSGISVLRKLNEHSKGNQVGCIDWMMMKFQRHSSAFKKR